MIYINWPDVLPCLILSIITYFVLYSLRGKMDCFRGKKQKNVISEDNATISFVIIITRMVMTGFIQKNLNLSQIRDQWI